MISYSRLWFLSAKGFAYRTEARSIEQPNPLAVLPELRSKIGHISFDIFALVFVV